MNSKKFKKNSAIKAVSSALVKLNKKLFNKESRFRSKLAKMLLKEEKGLVTNFGKTGRSAIHLAAILGDLDMCKWLLSKGVDVRSLTKNEYEDSVLHCAAMNKSHGKELVRYFVSEHCFDVNAKDKLGFTPLHCALYKENIETAEVLLTLGADLAVKRVTNDFRKCENLMHWCVSWNKLKSAKLVQEKNRNLVKDLRGDGYTTLHIAAKRADLNMCKWLVDECGMDPHAFAGKQKLSVLDVATCNKSHGKQIIMFLVNKYSLDVNRKNKDGFTPLHHAFYNDNIVAAEELVRFGADLTVKRGPENLLHDNVRKNKVKCVKYLIEKLPGLIAEAGPGGKNIVEIAAEKGDKEMMNLLNEKGFKFKKDEKVFSGGNE